MTHRWACALYRVNEHCMSDNSILAWHSEDESLFVDAMMSLLYNQNEPKRCLTFISTHQYFFISISARVGRKLSKVHKLGSGLFHTRRSHSQYRKRLDNPCIFRRDVEHCAVENCFNLTNTFRKNFIIIHYIQYCLFQKYPLLITPWTYLSPI